MNEENKALIEELEQEKEDIENWEEWAVGQYEECLDCGEPVRIGTLEYNPSHVLKLVDEIAYNCGYNDYWDERLGEIEDEINEIKQFSEEDE